MAALGSEKGGFDFNFINVPDELICQICHCVAREPQQVSCCGKVYCKTCIEESRKRSLSCPNCRGSSTVFSDRLSERRIKTLKLSCKNEEDGCQWNGTVEEYQRHLESCQFAKVACPNGCLEKVIKCNLESHEKSCLRREQKCFICKETGPYEDMISEHPAVCPEVRVLCRNKCGTKLLRRQLVAHRTTCPKEVVPCSYAMAGCAATVLRKDLQEHLTNNTQCHETLAFSKIQSQKTELEEVKRKLQETETKLLVSPVSFKVSEFTAKKEGNTSFTSPPFYTHQNGYKLYIVVRPNGNSDGQGTHISVYAYIRKGHNDDNLEWPFRGQVTVELLNQLSDTKHHSYSIDYSAANLDVCGKPTTDYCTTGWGARQFIAHSQLDSGSTCKYLKDDCLFFRISVKVLPSCKPWLTCTS